MITTIAQSIQLEVMNALKNAGQPFIEADVDNYVITDASNQPMVIRVSTKNTLIHLIEKSDGSFAVSSRLKKPPKKLLRKPRPRKSYAQSKPCYHEGD